VLIRLGRVLAILVLAAVAVSAVVGVATPTTGALEKAALVGAFGGCVLLAAYVSTIAERLTERVHSVR